MADAPWTAQLADLARVLGSDTAAAQAAGLNPQTVRGWARDGRRPRADTLIKLAAAHAEHVAPRHVPDLATDAAQEAAADSLILARQSCAAVLEMDSIEDAHAQCQRCLAVIDRKLARLP